MKDDYIDRHRGPAHEEASQTAMSIYFQTQAIIDGHCKITVHVQLERTNENRAVARAPMQKASHITLYAKRNYEDDGTAIRS